MKNSLLIILILLGVHSYGQELTCKDFKEGTFIGISTNPTLGKWKVIRENNMQKDFDFEVPDVLKEVGFNLEPKYAIIEWIDDCTCILKYDSSKAELDDMQKFVNSIGGFYYEMLKIENGCFYYKSTLKFEGDEQSLEGKFCIE